MPKHGQKNNMNKEKVECDICHCMFEPYEDEDGDLIDFECWLCNRDREMGAAHDGLMGCDG